MGVNDIVWFQAYKKNKPIQGRITRTGTAIELGCGWDETDKRTFYELETIDANPNFVFTRTTKRWLSNTEQSWNKPEFYIENLC